MNIPDFVSEVKLVKERFESREVYTVLLILLVGFGSFGLGRLSKLEDSQPPILLEYAPPNTAAAVSTASPEADAAKQALAPGGRLVASKAGTKYHFPWCSGAQRVSEANKIWFDSVEEARKAGYTPASNCKGLK
ncbi:MAG TPA: hypothetical protein DEP25_01830 [Candidatus Taylorbacteria bacterium]|nr:hypothetical protein [Candidatus Taylorbacteria bacterium]